MDIKYTRLRVVFVIEFTSPTVLLYGCVYGANQIKHHTPKNARPVLQFRKIVTEARRSLSVDKY